MNWTDRLLDLLEAKATFKQDDTAKPTLDRKAKEKKEANRALSRSVGTGELETLRTPLGQSTPRRKRAEAKAFERAGRRGEVSAEDAQRVTGARPSRNQPLALRGLRGEIRGERETFKRGVRSAASARAVRAATGEPAAADPQNMARVKARLQAKHGSSTQTGKTTTPPGKK